MRCLTRTYTSGSSATICSAVRCEVRAPLARRQDEVKKAFWRKVPEARPSKKRGLCEHEADSTRTGKCRVPLFRDPDLLSGPLVCPSYYFACPTHLPLPLRSTYSATRWGCSPGSGRLASASHMETRPHVAARGSYGFALAPRALSAQAQRRVSRVSHVTAPRRGRSELRHPYSVY